MKNRRMAKGFQVVVCLLVLLGGNLYGRDASIGIENAKLRVIEAKTFYRISEFFTGRENTGRRVIVRSDPEQRGGLYFIVRFSESTEDFPVGLKLAVDYYTARSGKMKHQEFALPYPMKRTKNIFAGITQEDTEGLRLPIAWRVQLLREDGTVYSELKSYLWEMPESL